MSSDITKTVLNRLERMDARMARSMAEMKNGEFAKSIARDIEKVVDKKLEKFQDIESSYLQRVEMKLAAVGAPGIIRAREWKNLVQESNRAVGSQIKKFVESKGRAEMEIKLFQDESHYRYFMQEARRINEASALTGSGAGVGGRTAYDPVFVSLRQDNPMRSVANQLVTEGSTYQFRVKGGSAGCTWGYNIQNNGPQTTEDTIIWQQNMMDLNVQFPIRTAALDDISGLEGSVVFDMLSEFSQVEGQSMISNNDQSGSTTLATGGTNGLRGLNSYPGQNATFTPGVATTAAFGTSGTASTNGMHSLSTLDQLVSNGNTVNARNVSYRDMINLVNAIPTQYRHLDLKFVMHPAMLNQVRGLVDGNNTPIFERTSPLIYDGTVGEMLGFKVVVNPYLDAPSQTTTGAAGTTSLYPCYFGAWGRGFAIVDRLNMVLRRYNETSPGNIVFYGEKRLATSVVDPFALVRFRSTATAS